MHTARILLADDHKEIRDKVRRYLEAEFNVLDAVDNGRALLDAAARLDPDICLLDISMPILDGIETANKLKESGSKAKVIFLTVHEDSDFLQAALKTGASGYVLKRRMASDLHRAVKEALAGRIFISSSVVSTTRVEQDEVPKSAA
ncbi:MAG TPA: response regulator transcription factor [Pyrinomonadaceae bacterium]|nr:response regulator transcription factor [Pyrinomonadaceae bacterium]